MTRLGCISAYKAGSCERERGATAGYHPFCIVMPSYPVAWTGQTHCYDTAGHETPCGGSGQDAQFRAGLAWPAPRFEEQGEVVRDRFTELTWTRDANQAEFPLTWTEAFGYVASLNRRSAFGYSDWRLPNRRELRSLLSHQARKPALPPHPFRNVFQGWYWSSTTAVISPAHAWYVHLEGARTFYGGKDQSYLV